MSGNQINFNSKELSGLTATLVGLFYPTLKVNFLLSPKLTKHKGGLHSILNLMPELTRSPGTLGESIKTKSLYLQLGGTLNHKLSLDDVLDKLFNEVFNAPNLLQFSNGRCTSIYDIKSKKSENDIRLLQHLINSSEGIKLVTDQIPLLIFRVRRQTNEHVLPNLALSLNSIVQDGSSEEFVLSAVICKTADSAYKSFIRITSAGIPYWMEYETLSRYTKILNLPDLEAQLKFWTNMKDFKTIKAPLQINELLTKGCVCIYLPSSTMTGVSSRLQLSNAGVDPSSKTGIRKGIEGDKNSCFIDSFLMALTYNNTKLKNEVFKWQSSVEGTLETNIIRLLHEICDKITDIPYYCPKSIVWVFRKEFEKFSSKVSGEMMDVDEFVGILFMKAVKSPYFINYKTLSGRKTGNYLHQIVCNLNSLEKKEIGIVSGLFSESMAFQQLRLVESPKPLLMIKMPRSNGKLIGYNIVIPDVELDVSELSESKVNCPAYTLQAVICLRHMHYTAFIRNLEGEMEDWIYFDSMGSNGPEVTELKNFGVALKQMNVENGTFMCDEVTRLLKDIHLCIYISNESNVETLSDSNVNQKQTEVVDVAKTEVMSSSDDKISKSGTIVEEEEIDKVKQSNEEKSISTHSEVEVNKKQEKIYPDLVPMEIDETYNGSEIKLEVDVLNNRHFDKRVFVSVCLSLTSRKNELQLLMKGSENSYQPGEIKLLEVVIKECREIDTKDCNQSLREIENFRQNLLSEIPDYSDYTTAFSTIFQSIFKEKPFFLKRNHNEQSYCLSFEDTGPSLVSINMQQHILEARLNWQLCSPLPAVIVLQFRRDINKGCETKLFPTYKISLKLLTSDLEVFGKLGSLICIDQNTNNCFVYRREKKPAYWKFFEITPEGDILNTGSIPGLDDYLRTKENELTPLNPSLTVEVSGSLANHISRVLQQSVFFIYKLESVNTCETIFDTHDCSGTGAEGIDDNNMDTETMYV